MTPRLAIRRLNNDDLDELAAIFANAGMWQFELGRGLERVETEAFLTRQLTLWADYGFGGCSVRELEGAALIGVVGLAVPTVLRELLPPVTVGCRFSPTVWGQGYATEAATAVLDQAFSTMALDAIGCVTGSENLRSVALAERLGMSLIRHAPVQRDDGQGFASAALFHIARGDWIAGRS